MFWKGRQRATTLVIEVTAGLKITSLLFRTTNLGSRAVVIVVGISHAIFGSLLFWQRNTTPSHV